LIYCQYASNNQTLSFELNSLNQYWIQIDVGFLSEQEKDTVLSLCKYGVVNGSHTVLGEIIGMKVKPVIGVPIYDEHTNHLKWIEEKNLGVLANNEKQISEAIKNIKANYSQYEQSLEEFSQNFMSSGAENSARIANEILENKK